MARNTAVLCLAVALLAVFTGNAAAIIGKGGHGKAVGGSVSLTVPKLSFETSCKDVCGDRCTLSPKQTCSDVSVPYQECKSVPETTTVKQCKKVCTTVTETPAPAPVTTTKEIPSLGKGKLISLGKGRHLMSKGLPIISFGKGGFGKGSQSCKDECADVPVTKNTIKCESKTRTVQRCSTSFEKSCSQVCRQVCSKVPVVSHEQISIGKGKGH